MVLLPTLAQDADKLLNALSDKAQTYKAYEISYTSQLSTSRTTSN